MWVVDFLVRLLARLDIEVVLQVRMDFAVKEPAIAVACAIL